MKKTLLLSLIAMYLIANTQVIENRRAVKVDIPLDTALNQSSTYSKLVTQLLIMGTPHHVELINGKLYKSVEVNYVHDENFRKIIKDSSFARISWLNSDNRPYVEIPINKLNPKFDNIYKYTSKDSTTYLIPMAIYVDGCRTEYVQFKEIKQWVKEYGLPDLSNIYSNPYVIDAILTKKYIVDEEF